MTKQQDFAFYSVVALLTIQVLFDGVAYDNLYGYYGALDLNLVALGVSLAFSCLLMLLYVKLYEFSDSLTAMKFACITAAEIPLTVLAMLIYNYDYMGDVNILGVLLLSTKVVVLIMDGGASNVIRMLSEHFGRFTDSVVRSYIHIRHTTTLL